MEIQLLSCPVCQHPHFDSVDALRLALITVASAPIPCPICSETQRGLDKLTIHLFSHVTFSITINTPAGRLSTTTVTTGSAPSTSPHQILSAAQNDSVSANTQVVNQIEHQSVAYMSFAPALLDKSTSVTIMNNDVNVNNSNTTNDTLNVATNVEQVIDEVSKAGCEKCNGNTNNDRVGAEPESIIQCDICNFNFTDRSILEMHQKLLHQTITDSETGTYSYHCHLCSKRFKMKGSLMVHLRVAHAGLGCVSGTSASRNPYGVTDGAAAANGKQQWPCDVCEKTFTTKYFLKKHKRLHTGEMPYVCAQCNKSFTFQQSYHKHMLYHSAEKPHACAECGRTFKELSTLHNHQRIHTGERPFACETCGKRFRQRVSYLVHRRIHTGAMPYACDACGKSFRYKVSQKSHKCTAAAAAPQPAVMPSSPSSLPDMQTLTLSPRGRDELHDDNLPTVAMLIGQAGVSEHAELNTINDESLKLLLYGSVN